MSDDVLCFKKGKAGIIRLTRPKALNALNHEMALKIEKALIDWQDDDDVSLVMIEGEGDKAFCAGGDIEMIYRAGLEGNFKEGIDFWQEEYRLNAFIGDYKKPYIAFMHGFVMGGGVGLSGHGSHRIVTDGSSVSMPECAIGLIPDVGGTHLLAKAKGYLGEFLGLTGFRMKAADAIHAGFADYYVPEADIETLKVALCETGETDKIESFSREAPEGILKQNQTIIDDIFKLATIPEMLEKLEIIEDDLAQRAVKAVKTGAPLSLLATLEMVKQARKHSSLQESLAFELRFTARACEKGEFLEGVRAAIIDKDRSPNWYYKTLEEVPEALLKEMLAPLKI